MSFQVTTEGDPEALVSSSRVGGPALNTTDVNVNGGLAQQYPWPYDAMRFVPYGAADDVGARQGIIQVHALLKAKTGTNKLGFYWGVTSAVTAVGWRVLAGSWLDMRLH